MVSTLVRLRDFAESGAAAIIPKTATVGIARAQVALGTSTLVSDRETLTTIVNGEVTLTMDPTTVYRVRLPTTEGFRRKVYLRTTTADLSLAELYRAHQIDPSTLGPVNEVPTVLDVLNHLQEQIDAIGPGTGGSGIALDTDGAPYFTVGAGTAIQLDTDGAPYFTV